MNVIFSIDFIIILSTYPILLLVLKVPLAQHLMIEVRRILIQLIIQRVIINRQQKAVWDSDTLALLRSECNGIESEQGSGFKGDAVLYNIWLLRNINIFF